MAAKRERELPWSDCKVAFGIDDPDLLWEAYDADLLPLPAGWHLDETDGTGARYVAVFRVDGVLRRSDGERMNRCLRTLGAIEVDR